MWLERRVKANPKDTDGYVSLAIMTWDELCNDSQCRTAMELRKTTCRWAVCGSRPKANQTRFDRVCRQLRPRLRRR